MIEGKSHAVGGIDWKLRQGKVFLVLFMFEMMVKFGLNKLIKKFWETNQNHLVFFATNQHFF